MKTIRKEHLLGQRGANLVERLVLEMGFIWRPTSIFDTGVDGEIEIRNTETGEISGLIVKVQVKAGQSYFKEETESSFTFIADRDDLEYWIKGNVPVILIVCNPDKGKAYWLGLRDYVKTHPQLLKERRVIFNNQGMIFDKTATHDLLEQTIPVELGIFFPPERRTEVLQTNLLRLASYPPNIFVADTAYRSKEYVWAFLKSENAEVTGEWFLHEKKICSFLDLGKSPLRSVCDLGTITAIETNEWALSDEMDLRSRFVRLATLAFKELCWKHRFRYNNEYECFFYSPSKHQVSNNTAFRIKYRSFHKSSSCMFFNCYGSKKDSSIIFYYRHLAFNSRFRLLNNTWFVSINPTYIFTYDGKRISSRIDEYLSNIKRLEHNSNVVRYVRALGQYLNRTRKGDLFEKPELISVEPAPELSVPFGLDDKQWFHREDEKPVITDPEDKAQLELL